MRVNVIDPWDDKLEGFIKINPYIDLDATYSWSDGNLTQVVITGLGYTKTITYSWTGDQLDSMAVTITK